MGMTHSAAVKTLWRLKRLGLSPNLCLKAFVKDVGLLNPTSAAISVMVAAGFCLNFSAAAFHPDSCNVFVRRHAEEVCKSPMKMERRNACLHLLARL